MKKIIGVALFLFVVFSAISVSSAAQLNSTDYGYVDKDIYGNTTSNQTIAIIIGVHPLENGTHTAVANALANKSENLTKRYVLYTVHVTKDASDYDKGRMNGQLLAQQFIVPDVSSENPILVMDIHENRYTTSGYAYPRFLYPISNDATTMTDINEIISEMPFLVTYTPPSHTSTAYVTEPIANKGIPTIIYENYMYDSQAQKSRDASNIIDALDSEIGNTPAITASPREGTYYGPQNVVLTANETSSEIHYTLDGSNPTKNSPIYTNGITISTSGTLKFTAWNNDTQTPVYTQRYIIYKLVTYTYPVSVPVLKWYKSHCKWKSKYVTVWVKKSYISYYKYKGKWKSKVKYKWVKTIKYTTAYQTGQRWELT